MVTWYAPFITPNTLFTENVNSNSTLVTKTLEVIIATSRICKDVHILHNLYYWKIVYCFVLCFIFSSGDGRAPVARTDGAVTLSMVLLWTSTFISEAEKLMLKVPNLARLNTKQFYICNINKTGSIDLDIGLQLRGYFLQLATSAFLAADHILHFKASTLSIDLFFWMVKKCIDLLSMTILRIIRLLFQVIFSLKFIAGNLL